MSSHSRSRRRRATDAELLQRVTHPIVPKDAMVAAALLAVLGAGLVLIVRGLF